MIKARLASRAAPVTLHFFLLLGTLHELPHSFATGAHGHIKVRSFGQAQNVQKWIPVPKSGKGVLSCLLFCEIISLLICSPVRKPMIFECVCIGVRCLRVYMESLARKLTKLIGSELRIHRVRVLV